MKPLEILNKYFGYSNFRIGQREIIDTILNKKDVVAIMPTGGGKSICYQIPALLFEGITIVISPLISLMKDQVDFLNSNGINATYINSSLSLNKYKEVIENIKNDEYKIIYVAPERLSVPEFLEIIKDKNISQVAVDEAHCISQWGHDFRESYKNISTFLKKLKYKPVVTAFTATASNEVKCDIVNLLELKNAKCFITGFNRENLKIDILKSSNKDKFILDYIKNHKDESGIIYAATRKSVENLYKKLSERGFLVSKYHAGLSQTNRNKNQDEFINDKTNIMIATNAFGMGIDKPNIRWVIHYNMPQNIESYYQEIGRAGRDGEKSECILLFLESDVITQKYLIDIEFKNNSRQILKHKKLQQMVDLVYSNDCYRKSILSYFGEDFKGMCNNCSNCLDEGEIVDKTIDAQKVISCIVRMKKRYGITMIVDVLRGSKNKKVIENEFDKLSTYAILKNYSKEDLKTFINTLISHKFLDLIENVNYKSSYSTVGLNEKSKKVLLGEEVVKFKESVVSEKLQENDELFERLRILRKNIATEKNIAPYIIFGDTTLKLMSNNLPTSKEEMLQISGVGERKYEIYGEDFLNVIKEYMKEENITQINDEKYFYVNSDEKLYNLLLEFREKNYPKKEVGPNMFLSKNNLKEISGRYPINSEQLSDISGIGKEKCKKYSDEITNIVKEYISENNMEVKWKNKSNLKLILDNEYRKPKDIALDLLHQNKSIEYVADYLDMSHVTIINYIHDYALDGNKLDIDLSKFYSDSDKETVLENFNNEISIIRENVSKEISYLSIIAVVTEKLLEELV
jgi:ATP-dependent DNA helicase RecQ